jgi:hypothetical protein
VVDAADLDGGRRTVGVEAAEERGIVDDRAPELGDEVMLVGHDVHREGGGRGVAVGHLKSTGAPGFDSLRIFELAWQSDWKSRFEA